MTVLTCEWSVINLNYGLIHNIVNVFPKIFFMTWIKVYITRWKIWHYENCFPIQFTAGLSWGQCPCTSCCLSFKTFRWNTWVLEFTAISLDIIIFIALHMMGNVCNTTVSVKIDCLKQQIFVTKNLWHCSK